MENTPYAVVNKKAGEVPAKTFTGDENVFKMPEAPNKYVCKMEGEKLTESEKKLLGIDPKIDVVRTEKLNEALVSAKTDPFLNSKRGERWLAQGYERQEPWDPENAPKDLSQY